MATEAPYQVCEPLTAREYADLKQSIQSYGCLVPIEVDEDGAVIDGHHRRAACEELGLSYERVLVAGLTEDQKIARAIEVNNVRRAPKWRTREEREAYAAQRKSEGASNAVIAEEIGVSEATARRALSPSSHDEGETPAEVVGKDGKTYPSAQPDRSAEAVAARHEAVVQLSAAGASVAEISKAIGLSKNQIYKILHRSGHDIPEPDTGPSKSTAAVQARYERVRDLAAQGYTTQQIAVEVGLGEAALRSGCKQRGIEIPADAVVGKRHRHDSNRIVNEAVHALEAAVMGLRLVRLEDLDRDQIQDWTASLTDSIRALNQMNKQMKEMVQ